ncbi:hypothetical protein GQ457_01G007320 [Hibiscus cannabinus]
MGAGGLPWGWIKERLLRLDPMEPPLDMPETRWYRHLKEPACVVGEQRQLDLALFDLTALGDTCTVGCFLISSKLSSVAFSSIAGGFFFSSFVPPMPFSSFGISEI